MRTTIDEIRIRNKDLFEQIVVDMGMLRKRNECASCGKRVDIKDYHIQLCRKCRITYIDEMQDKALSTIPKNIKEELEKLSIFRKSVNDNFKGARDDKITLNNP